MEVTAIPVNHFVGMGS